jgi:hypothetical protein
MFVEVVAGLALGILIGVLSSLVFLSMLTLVVKARKMKDIGAIAAQLFGLPTFWFGGPWLGSKLLQTLKWEPLLPYYLLSLTATFLLVVCGPLSGYVRRIRSTMAP